MKKTLPLILLLLMLCGGACAEYWDAGSARPAVCCDDRPGCQVLQTVMMGSFAAFDPEDGLNVRVLSAALPLLTAVTEEDFAHFAEAFNVEREPLGKLYYIALGNCLRSDFILSPQAQNMDAQNARIVLNLFLNPSGEDAAAQMRAIRENCTDADIQLLAVHAGVPVEFVRHLIGNGSSR